MTEVRLNDKTFTLPDDQATVAALLALAMPEGTAPTALATAVNGEFVPRTQRANRVLKAGDVVTTFQPITGG